MSTVTSANSSTAVNSALLENSEEKRERWIAKGNKCGLRACECGSHELWMRELIENTILKKIVRIHPVCEKKLNVLSIGSGRLLQDYLLLKKMMYVGYTGIDITMVDPVLTDKTKLGILAIIIDKINRKNRHHISIQGYEKMQTCLEGDPSKKYHLIYAVDFEKVPFKSKMLWQIRSCLAEGGLLYVSCKRTRLSMSKGIFKLRNSAGHHKTWKDHFDEERTSLLTRNYKIRFPLDAPHLFKELAISIGNNSRHLELNHITEKFDAKINEFWSWVEKFFPGVPIEIEEASEAYLRIKDKITVDLFLSSHAKGL